MTRTFEKTRVYVKKVGIFGPYTVWLVDGEYVRKEISEDFVEFEHHIHLHHIPVDELWIDHETHFRERHFFIETAITERMLTEKGLPEKTAHKKVIREEARKRAQAIPKNLRGLSEKHEELVKHIHKNLLQEFSTPTLRVWLIHGKPVRDFFLTEYALGGHDRVYPFIPEGEIWIEDVLMEQERRFIILHELHERFLMGEGKAYREAHHGATIVEDRYRDYPAKLEERIREELAKNNV